MGNSAASTGFLHVFSCDDKKKKKKSYMELANTNDDDNGVDPKYKLQLQSIQKLTIMVGKLEKLYSYYREQSLMAKSKAIAYEHEGHDSIKALQFVRITMNFETAMQSTSDLETILLNIQIKLRQAVTTGQVMELIQEDNEILQAELNKIYNETKISQTLNNLEFQFERVQKIQDIVQDTTRAITASEKEKLSQWCSNRYKLLKEFTPETVAQVSPNTHNEQEKSKMASRYYAQVLEEDIQQHAHNSGIMSYLPSLFDGFFAQPQQQPTIQQPLVHVPAGTEKQTLRM